MTTSTGFTSDTDTGMPSGVSAYLSRFDRFATQVSRFASRALFFLLCVFLVVLWLPSYFLLQSLNTWQLIINTITTIVTFLMVALLQNSQSRNDTATQDKLNAVAAGLAELISLVGKDDPRAGHLSTELRDAVGLENRTSS